MNLSQTTRLEKKITAHHRLQDITEIIFAAELYIASSRTHTHACTYTQRYLSDYSGRSRTCHLLCLLNRSSVIVAGHSLFVRYKVCVLEERLVSLIFSRAMQFVSCRHSYKGNIMNGSKEIKDSSEYSQ